MSYKKQSSQMENITETGILLLAILHYNLYILMPYIVYYTYTIVYYNNIPPFHAVNNSCSVLLLVIWAG